ncbi:response regulator [Mariprofundus erugo]|uniref:Response regulator n=1 Tax=Mariprofundus erugo TaxID=2528639 RepID=A0A5R9GGU1_9PROT|nr:response regulator [Mariprofundus erugo]TLS65650.1 response regulator [Mariprofundus erugo]TLS75653.1 response regulator [Mariprofundus erugo]
MKRIVIIEDNALNRKLACRILSGSGYDVIEAVSAEDGLALVRLHRPSLVLMDMQLPGMDGIEATRQIRGDATTAHIPVLAVTALAMAEDRAHVLANGCDGYLAKPYAYQALLQAVESLLTGYGAES